MVPFGHLRHEVPLIHCPFKGTWFFCRYSTMGSSLCLRYAPPSNVGPWLFLIAPRFNARLSCPLQTEPLKVLSITCRSEPLAWQLHLLPSRCSWDPLLSVRCCALSAVSAHLIKKRSNCSYISYCLCALCTRTCSTDTTFDPHKVTDYHFVISAFKFYRNCLYVLWNTTAVAFACCAVFWLATFPACTTIVLELYELFCSPRVFAVLSSLEIEKLINVRCNPGTGYANQLGKQDYQCDILGRFHYAR